MRRIRHYLRCVIARVFEDYLLSFGLRGAEFSPDTLITSGTDTLDLIISFLNQFARSLSINRFLAINVEIKRSSLDSVIKAIEETHLLLQ